MLAIFCYILHCSYCYILHTFCADTIPPLLNNIYVFLIFLAIPQRFRMNHLKNISLDPSLLTAQPRIKIQGWLEFYLIQYIYMPITEESTMSKPMSQSVVIFKRLVSTSSEPSVRRLSPLQSLGEQRYHECNFAPK